MINVQRLKGEIIANGYTQTRFAKELGMTQKTFGVKVKKGVFGSDEIQKMIKLLSITNPADIFFAQEVASKVTKVE